MAKPVMLDMVPSRIQSAVTGRRLAAWVADGLRRIHKAHLRERTRLELERLTDHELRDIGLVRGDISKVVDSL